MAYETRNTATPNFEDVTPNLILTEGGDELGTESGIDLAYEGVNINNITFESRSAGTPSYEVSH